MFLITIMILLTFPASAKTTISISTPTIATSESNIVARDIITVGESGTNILISTSTYHSSGYKSSGYATLTIKNSYGDVILSEEMLRSKADDYRANYAYSWNTSKYLQSDEYTFTVSYASKSASVDKYIINVKDWEVTEYYEKEIVKNNEVTKYIFVENKTIEVKNQTQYVYVKTENKKNLAIMGISMLVLGSVIGYFVRKEHEK